MGGKRKTSARETRRYIAAKAIAEDYLKERIKNPRYAGATDQEQIEMDRAYSQSLCDACDSEFADMEDEVFAVTEAGQLRLPPPLTKPVEPPNDQEPAHITSLRDRWRVLITEDHKLTIPDLCLEIFIANPSGDEEPQFAEWLIRANCRKADSLDEADLCIFTGGPDVDPFYYGEPEHPTTRTDTARDLADLQIYMECYDKGIPMFGVCRGAQFLHVMNGGKLYQDISNHVGEHKMLDTETKESIERVSSMHHQAVRYESGSDIKILGQSLVSDKRVKYDPLIEQFITEGGAKPDIEAFYYAETGCLGVQGHPEWKGTNAYSVWCLKLINRWIIENPDIDFSNGGVQRRLRADLIGMRGLGGK